MNFNRILAIAAHADDEISCAGTISKLQRLGAEIYVVVFTFSEESVPKDFPRDIVQVEFNRSMIVLNVPENNIFRYYDFKVRHFPSKRQEILEILVGLKKLLDPDLVLMPSLFDIHQDHNTIAREGLRAFNKSASIFSYEMCHNTVNFNPTIFIELSHEDLNNKILAAECYKSQAFRDYSDMKYIDSIVTMRGIQVGNRYAEAFETVRLRL
jgi:LmbE family N-acetylglucosaminyl deacetylase